MTTREDLGSAPSAQVQKPYLKRKREESILSYFSRQSTNEKLGKAREEAEREESDKQSVLLYFSLQSIDETSRKAQEEERTLFKQKRMDAEQKKLAEEQQRISAEHERLAEERHQHRCKLYRREIDQIEEMRRKRKLDKTLYHIPCRIPEQRFVSDNCPICLNDFKTPEVIPLDERLSTFLTCGHLVHVKCISEYFLSPSSEGRCPVCRHQEKPRM
jgi:hypothetical protein